MDSIQRSSPMYVQNNSGGNANKRLDPVHHFFKGYTCTRTLSLWTNHPAVCWSLSRRFVWRWICITTSRGEAAGALAILIVLLTIEFPKNDNPNGFCIWKQTERDRHIQRVKIPLFLQTILYCSCSEELLYYYIHAVLALQKLSPPAYILPADNDDGNFSIAIFPVFSSSSSLSSSPVSWNHLLQCIL